MAKTTVTIRSGCVARGFDGAIIEPMFVTRLSAYPVQPAEHSFIECEAPADCPEHLPDLLRVSDELMDGYDD